MILPSPSGSGVAKVCSGEAGGSAKAREKIAKNCKTWGKGLTFKMAHPFGSQQGGGRMEEHAGADVVRFGDFRFDRRHGLLARQNGDGDLVPVPIGSRALEPALRLSNLKIPLRQSETFARLRDGLLSAGLPEERFN